MATSSVAPCNNVENALHLSRQHQFSQLLTPSERQRYAGEYGVLMSAPVKTTLVPKRERRRNLNIYEVALKKQIRKLESKLSEEEKRTLQLQDPQMLGAFLQYITSQQNDPANVGDFEMPDERGAQVDFNVDVRFGARDPGGVPDEDPGIQRAQNDEEG